MCKWKDLEFRAKFRRIQAVGGRIFGAGAGEMATAVCRRRRRGVGAWDVEEDCRPGVRGCSVGNGKTKTGAVRAVGDPTHAAKSASWVGHPRSWLDGLGKNCAWASSRTSYSTFLIYRDSHK